MSLIFETLQELNTRADDGDNHVAASDGTADGDRKATRRILPMTVLIVACLLVSGIAAVWTVTFLHNRAEEKKAKEATAVKHRTVGEILAAEQAVGDEQGASPTVQARFLPADVAADPATTTVHEEPVGSAAFIPKEAPEQPSAEAQTADTAGTLPKHETPSLETALTNIPAPTEAAPSDGGRSLPLRAEELPGSARPSNDKPLKLTDPMTPAQRQAEQARIAARRRSDKIQRLVSSLESAIAQSDGGSATTDRVDGMLRDLEKLKGGNSVYVEKMRAYWLMKQGRYDQAESLLAELFGENERDVEVGLNLAIIAIQKGERRDALDRLKKLRKDFPDNVQVADLIRKMQ